jgi:hypothetical protein
MVYRRILFTAQFVAAIVLPTWVLVGRGLLDDGIGWEFLVYIVICPFLAIAMLAVAGLITARRDVRLRRAVSWLDAGLLSAWWLAIAAYGLWASTVLAVAIVVLAVVIFWSSAWQLFTETRTRFRGLMAGYEEAANGPGAGHPDPAAPRVIVITPDEDDTRR